MKKILSRIAIALVLVTLAFSFTACLGRTTNTTPAYVNTYYVEGKVSTTDYIEIRSDNIFIIRSSEKVENVTVDKAPVFGVYIAKDSTIKLYKDNDIVAVGEQVDGAWVITYNDTQFVKKAAATGCQTSNWSTYVIFGVLIVAIIGLFIWSSISKRKQAKQAQETVSKLKVGDRVKTIGGICGYVAEIDDTENTFVLDVKSGDKSSFIKFDKGAIYQTAPAGGNGSEVKAEEKAAEKPAEEKAEKPKKAKKTEKEDK